MSIFRKIFVGVVIAMAGLSISTVSAQTPTDQFGISYEVPAATMQHTFVQPALGLALKPEEAAILAANDCFVGPIGTTRALYVKARKEKEQPCSKEFYSRVDNYVGKESTVSFVVARVADGYLSCSLRKITNRGDNRDGCALYPFNPAFNNAGQVGKYADVSRTEGGDTAKGNVLGAIVAGVASNVTGALANAGAQKLFGTYCGANGGCGTRINVQGSSANAGANAEGGKATAGSSSSSTANTNTGAACTSNCVPKPDGTGK